jgi:hypothetical protein
VIFGKEVQPAKFRVPLYQNFRWVEEENRKRKAVESFCIATLFLNTESAKTIEFVPGIDVSVCDISDVYPSSKHGMINGEKTPLLTLLTSQ